jgi:hypothetical protein
MSEVVHLPQFFVKQKLTMMVNRYEVLAANPDGSIGQLLALAEQKRFAFKEQVTFFEDAGRTRPVFGFKARQVIDLNAGYDVTDAQGDQIGFFRKDFGASLLRSTFHLEGPDYAGTGRSATSWWPCCAGSVTSRSCPSTSTSWRPTERCCSRAPGRRRCATSTPSLCPTRVSTSGSRPRSRSPWTR